LRQGGRVSRRGSCPCCGHLLVARTMGECTFSFVSMAFPLPKCRPAGRLLPLHLSGPESRILWVQCRPGSFSRGHMLPRTPDSRLAPSSGKGGVWSCMGRGTPDDPAAHKFRGRLSIHPTWPAVPIWPSSHCPEAISGIWQSAIQLARSTPCT